MFKRLLAYPTTQDIDLDSPEMTNLRRQIIKQKLFLKQLYQEWYELLIEQIPFDITGQILELGSGGGFLKETDPNLITSDVLKIDNIDVVLDGHFLPIRNSSLKAIVMINVLHHLHLPRTFFHEAARCLVVGGVIVMVEPWLSTWSKLIYTHLHHEPFLPDARSWDFNQSGPLSGANGALPWIIFNRDRKVFEDEFPDLKVRRITEHTPFRYLVSGGVSMRALTPSWTFNLWRRFEEILSPFMSSISMFSTIIVEKMDNSVINPENILRV